MSSYLRRSRVCAVVLAVAGCANDPVEAQPRFATEEPGPRLVMVVVPGVAAAALDAMDAATPNLATLNHRVVLRPAMPTEELSTWQTLHSGVTAQRHGIYDGTSRMANAYAFVPSLRVTPSRISGGRMSAPTFHASLTRSPFWDVLAASGVQTSILFPPFAMPLAEGRARVVAGRLPAVHGVSGLPVMLVRAGEVPSPPVVNPSRVDRASDQDDSDDAQQAPEPGVSPSGVTVLEELSGGIWRGEVPLLRRLDDERVPVLKAPVVVRDRGERISVRLGSNDLELKAGERSPYLSVEFRADTVSLRGRTRLHLLSIRPLRLLVEAVGVDPERPAFTMSSPASLSRSLVGRAGLGPSTDSGAWSHLGGAAFVGDEFRAKRLEEEARWRSQALIAELESSPSRILVLYLDLLERARLLERSESRGEQAPISSAYQGALIALDMVIGALRSRLASGDTLVLVSPSAPGRAERLVDLNVWLAQKRYLRRNSSGDIEWQRTQIYAAGNGGIYINVKGRDPDGTVAPMRATKLAKKVARELRGLKDRGDRVVQDVLVGDEVFVGPRRASAPDVMVNLAEGYAIAPASRRGNVGSSILQPAGNILIRSGPLAVRDAEGVVLANRPLAVDEARLEDLAATAYVFGGVVQSEAPGRPWFAPPAQ